MHLEKDDLRNDRDLNAWKKESIKILTGGTTSKE